MEFLKLFKLYNASFAFSKIALLELCNWTGSKIVIPLFIQNFKLQTTSTPIFSKIS